MRLFGPLGLSAYVIRRCGEPVFVVYMKPATRPVCGALLVSVSDRGKRRHHPHGEHTA